MIVRSSSTSAGDSGVPSAASSRAAAAGGAPSSARATSTVALALDEVVARGLPGLGGVAEDTEQVVAQLERLAQRQPEAGELLELAVVAPARPAPMWSGRSMEYFRDL